MALRWLMGEKAAHPLRGRQGVVGRLRAQQSVVRAVLFCLVREGHIGVLVELALGLACLLVNCVADYRSELGLLLQVAVEHLELSPYLPVLLLGLHVFFARIPPSRI